MKHHDKQDFPLDQIRRFLEPGPIVLVSSAHKGERNLMTMGWHMMLGFAPARFGCYLWEGNHSYELNAVAASASSTCPRSAWWIPWSASATSPD